jgi:hypothetical protein
MIWDDVADPQNARHATVSKRTICAALSGHPKNSNDRTTRVREEKCEKKKNKKRRVYLKFNLHFFCLKIQFFSKSTGASKWSKVEQSGVKTEE